MERSKGVIVAGILLFGMVPIVITTHALFSQGQMRIADPMIGAPQFSKPGGTIPIFVEKQGVVDSGSWRVQLQSVDFTWAHAITLDIDASYMYSEGRHELNVRVPVTAMPGLYDLSVSCNSLGTRLSVVEPHSVCIYDNVTTLRLAHLTDPHVTIPDRTEVMNVGPPHTAVTWGDRSINGNLRWLLENVSVVRPDLVLLTGDIATRGLEEEFIAAREAIMASSAPVLCTLGNHDHRSPPGFVFHLAPAYFSRSIDDWRVICLDTGATEGNGLFGEQMRWFKEQLAQAFAAGQQVIVGMHIPSTTEPVGGYVIEGNEEFRELCEQYSIRGIFTGHHHYSDAHYANGSQVLTPDPIPASAGPIYVKTGSTTLDYDNGERGIGWRFVRSHRNGSMNIGYDMAGTGTSDPIEDLPLNGLLRAHAGLQVNLTNYYRITFANVTLPVQFALLSPTDQFLPSEGEIVGQVRTSTMAGLLLNILLPETANKQISFTRV
ncbi:MAG: metallophosphoesterase [Candidatus Lokiarchaeota archaeon]|nr:metallophosphoesterase [Candidatus Lokiarchaeota archaeon]